jgi:hypothetical protein
MVMGDGAGGAASRVTAVDLASARTARSAGTASGAGCAYVPDDNEGEDDYSAEAEGLLGIFDFWVSIWVVGGGLLMGSEDCVGPSFSLEKIKARSRSVI